MFIYTPLVQNITLSWIIKIINTERRKLLNYTSFNPNLYLDRFNNISFNKPGFVRVRVSKQIGD